MYNYNYNTFSLKSYVLVYIFLFIGAHITCEYCITNPLWLYCLFPLQFCIPFVLFDKLHSWIVSSNFQPMLGSVLNDQWLEWLIVTWFEFWKVGDGRNDMKKWCITAMCLFVTMVHMVVISGKPLSPSTKIISWKDAYTCVEMNKSVWK